MARRRKRTNMRNLAEYIGARHDPMIQVWHTTCPRHRDRQCAQPPSPGLDLCAEHAEGISRLRALVGGKLHDQIR